MSYDDPSPAPRRPRRVLLTACTAVVLAGCAVVLVWQSVGGRHEDAGGGQGPSAHPSRSASPSSTPSNRPPGSDSGGKGGNGGKGKPAVPPASSGPLRGKVVVIDPGHNPGNRRHTSAIARSVGIGNDRKECDTTGTATNGGYAEAEFTLDVSRRIRKLLAAQGARVLFTQDGDRAWGPCVDERARIGNAARADAVVSVHADGSAAGNRGFHVILPAAVRSGAANTSAIVGPSRDLGERIAGLFVRATGSSPSNYIGGGSGLDVRSDLGGLNLSTVPKVFIECGNMRDAQEASRLTSPAWRGRAAEGIADGVASFLTSKKS